ncbi:hypothetical protein RUND412_008123 [Rhizina undulata]
MPTEACTPTNMSIPTSVHPLEDDLESELPGSSSVLSLVTTVPPHPTSGPTLLPAPIANLVSLFSKSTTLSLRVGSLIGETLLDSARVGTLTSLEIGKAAIGGILTRASRDLSYRQQQQGGPVSERQEIESWAEKGVQFLHTSLSLTQLILSTSFELSSTTLSTLTDFAQNYVFTLDSIFGSTESSRAIAAIVKLVRKEFSGGVENGPTKVGVTDIIAGLSCFAILQMRARGREIKADIAKSRVVWDVVINSEGVVIECDGVSTDKSLEPTAGVKREGVPLDGDDQDHDRNGLPTLLFDTLPKSADISITTSSTTTRTTTIQVHGHNAPIPEFTPPSNSVVLCESSHHATTGEVGVQYKIVYETVTRNVSNKRVRRENGEVVAVSELPEIETAGTTPTPQREIEEIPISSDEKELPAVTRAAYEKEDVNSSRSGSAQTKLISSAPTPDKRKKGKEREGKEREGKRDKEKGKEKDKKSRRRSLISPSSPPTSPKKREKKSKTSAAPPNYIVAAPKPRDPPASKSSGSSLMPNYPARPQKPGSGSCNTRPASPEIRFTSTMGSRRGSFTLETTNSQHILQRPGSSQSNLGDNNHYTPSIYTLPNAFSQASLTLSYEHPSSDTTILRDMRRYVRFASASYGQNFMRLLGIGESTPGHVFPNTGAHHAEHHAFSFHTSLPVDTILLSSHMDPVADAEGGGIPLVHFVCLDHVAQSVVVVCRGTLGLEDVLTDLTCEYSDFVWSGRGYRVHKGMLTSALLLLRKASRVLGTIKAALEEWPEYGLVLCGHSLGGGVAALLAILLAKRTKNGFVSSNEYARIYAREEIGIPAGRKVHAYAYGAPACVCSRLRRDSIGLVTTVVNGADIVPSLSFGVLRDFQAVALAFKEDTSGTTVMSRIRRLVTEKLAARRLFVGDEDDDYLYAVLKTLRAGMVAEKLVPPGEVWWVASEGVFRNRPGVGGIAAVEQVTRVRMRVVGDVEGWFGEVRFGRGMLADHSPGGYENALGMLERGVCRDEDED